MKQAIWLLSIPLLLLTLSAVGCSPQEVGYSINDLELTAEQSIFETLNAYPSDTPPQVPTLLQTNTPNPNATLTPTKTDKPTSTSTNTVTPTPLPTQGYQAYVSGDTNCRTGPSNHYDWKTIVKAGQTVTIVGESQDRYYWVIENPNGSGSCWLWKYFTTPIAPIGRVPILSSPPTKTPTKTPTQTPSPNARIQFNQVTTCYSQEVLVISVFNSSRRILGSWRVRIFNLPGKIHQGTHHEDYFSHDDEVCDLTLNNLDYRDTGYIIAPFDSSSATDYLVEVEACAISGIERDCAFEGFIFDVFDITATPTYTPTFTSTATSTSTSTPTFTPTP